MNRLDRYILKTAGGAFVAVLVVLTSMVWVTTALRRFELLTAQGQTIWVFFAVTALSLPTLMVVVAPIALFLAVVYTLHKLNSDSELVAMSAAGVGPWHILRAPLALSIVVAIVSMLVSADVGARQCERRRGDKRRGARPVYFDHARTHISCTRARPGRNSDGYFHRRLA